MMFTLSIRKARDNLFDINDKKDYIVTLTHVDDGNTHTYSDVHVRAGFTPNSPMPKSRIKFRDAPTLFDEPEFGKPNAAVLNIAALLDSSYSDGSSSPLEIHLEVVSGAGSGNLTDVGNYILYVQMQFDDEVTVTTTTTTTDTNANTQSSIEVDIVDTASE